jgi:flagellar basal body-associated protein FliL
MTRFKLPIIIATVLVAIVAGLWFAGVIPPGKDAGPAKKHKVEPVALAEPFIVNLKDADGAYLSLGLAVELEPMDEEHWLAYTGANAGGHGGGGEAPGPPAVANYSKFRDAVISTAAQYSAAELLTPEGKTEFKKDLLSEFAAIAERDAADAKASAPHDGHVAPPFHVMEVQFTNFAVQQ